MSVPRDMHQIVLRAIADAREYRRHHRGPKHNDAEFLSEYRDLAFAFATGHAALVTASEIATEVLPTGYITLSATDHMTVLGALDDATVLAAAKGRFGDVARYRALSRVLGDDR